MIVLTVLARSQQLGNLYFENEKVVYRKVFEVDTINADELQKMLENHLIRIPAVKELQYIGEFIGIINGMFVDVDKYLSKRLTYWSELSKPMDAKMKIQVKNGRYRVIIEEIKFINPSPYSVFSLDIIASERNLKTTLSSNFYKRSLGYLDQFLTDLFTLKIESFNQDDW